MPPRAPVQVPPRIKRLLGFIGLGIILVGVGLGLLKARAVPSPASTPTPYIGADCQANKICIRWFVGLGTGTELSQVQAEEAALKDFNASQDKIQLILEVYPYNYSHDALSTEI